MFVIFLYLGFYYDQHQRPIVHLIHRFELSSIGKRTGRNELRLKYHYHSCLFRLPPDIFLRLYNLLYSRFIQFNRYTIILGKMIIFSFRLFHFCFQLSEVLSRQLSPFLAMHYHYVGLFLFENRLTINRPLFENELMKHVELF